jgi:DNA replication and repair protein RecF
MLSVHSISLLQFKNYQNRSFEFDKRIVCICGKNGVGKTNLLDAVYYLCFTKSYFSRSDAMNVKHEQEGFRLEGEFVLNDKPEKVACILRENGKKEFSVNGELYDKFSKHIGHYPCVIIAPDDIQIITGGSEERRKFVDTLISQIDAGYLQQLITYNKIVQQRNSLLKTFAETGNCWMCWTGSWLSRVNLFSTVVKNSWFPFYPLPVNYTPILPGSTKTSTCFTKQNYSRSLLRNC